MIKSVTYNKLAINHKTATYGSYTQPLHIHPEDLTFAHIKFYAAGIVGTAQSCELITIPAELIHSLTGVVGKAPCVFAYHKTECGDPCTISLAFKIDTILSTKKAHSLAEIVFGVIHNKGVHDQQAFARLIVEHSLGFSYYTVA